MTRSPNRDCKEVDAEQGQWASIPRAESKQPFTLAQGVKLNTCARAGGVQPAARTNLQAGGGAEAARFLRAQARARPLRSGRKCVAARGHAGRLGGCAAMDVGADEFEQSLPLLQELVLGADFVGKAPRFQAAGGSCGGCARGGRGGEVRPSLPAGAQSSGTLGSTCPLGCAGAQVTPSRRKRAAWAALAVAASVFPA